MKRRVWMILTAAAMTWALAGCRAVETAVDAPGESAAVAEATGEMTADGTTVAVTAAAADLPAELALITDHLGSIQDRAINQEAWEGLVQYAQESGRTYAVYEPEEDSVDAYLAAIEQAVEQEAKVIVCPGFLFEIPVYLAQKEYPQVRFILLDGEPHSEDYAKYETGENVMAIHFDEAQIGFLAGYGAVKEGYRRLGFMGAMKVSSVKAYGYGFVQGADLAARELKLNDVEIAYTYTGSFAATDAARETASSWYADGTQVIFGCGGAVGYSALKAAEASGGAVIGADTDQGFASDTVVVSAVKEYSTAVCRALEACCDGDFPGGKAAVLGAAEEGVGLAMESARFHTFQKRDYEDVRGRLAGGEISVQKPKGKNGNPKSELKRLLVKIQYSEQENP